MEIMLRRIPRPGESPCPALLSELLD